MYDPFDQTGGGIGGSWTIMSDCKVTWLYPTMSQNSSLQQGTPRKNCKFTCWCEINPSPPGVSKGSTLFVQML